MTHIEADNKDAAHRGRRFRSREEGPVMGLERRGTAIDSLHVINWKQKELRTERNHLKGLFALNGIAGAV